MKNVLIIMLGAIVLSGCGVPKIPDENKPAMPKLISISYTNNGAVVTISDTFIYFINVNPDFGSGSCNETKSEIVFRGTVDSNTKSLEIIGADSPITTISNGNFEVIACLPAGSAAIRISAVGEAEVKSEKSVNFSLTITGSNSSDIRTIGFGHPKYPAPGFVIGGTALKNVIKTGDLVLNTVIVGDTTAKDIQSTGNTDLTLRLGFVAAVRENN